MVFARTGDTTQGLIIRYGAYYVLFIKLSCYLYNVITSSNVHKKIEDNQYGSVEGINVGGSNAEGTNVEPQISQTQTCSQPPISQVTQTAPKPKTLVIATPEMQTPTMPNIPVGQREWQG